MDRAEGSAGWCPPGLLVLVVYASGRDQGTWGVMTAILMSACLSCDSTALTLQAVYQHPFSGWDLLSSKEGAIQGSVCIICPVASTGLCPAVVPCSPYVCMYVLVLMQGPPSAEDPPK